MSAPAGIAKGLQRALGLETIELDQPVRRAGPMPLLNPRRLEIVLTAAAYPGIHLRSASRLLLSPLPSLRFHTVRLEELGLLRVRRSGPRASLFVPGLFPGRAEPLLVTWEEPTDRRVLRLVRDSPGVAESVLRRQFVGGSGILSATLRRLRSAGAVRTSASKDRRLWPSAAWARFESLCRDGAPDRLERFLVLLRSQGLNPTLEEAGADWARISVDGPRFRIRFVLPLNPLNRPE